MTITSEFRHPSLDEIHRASMLDSLAHRLEVARAANNTQLIALLEQEQKELLAEAPLSTLLKRVQAWWQRLKNDIAQASQLQVTQEKDETGYTWWHAYDPNSGREVYTDSESELVMWIEQHYQGH